MDVKQIVNNKKVQVGVASALIVGGGAAVFYILRKRRNKVETQTYYITPENDPQIRLFDDEGNAIVLEVNDRILIDPTPREAPFRHSLKYKVAMEELQERAKQTEDVEFDTEIVQALRANPELVQEAVADALQELSDGSHTQEEINARFNVFSVEEPTDVWDYDDELSRRKPDEPYVLHVQEFIENESGFHQSTVTYYAGDDIMANEEDRPIYDFKRLFGELKFGHGSGDLGVVYIRNESFKSEWEVIYHPGKFSIEIMGDQYDDQAETELKHSVQKFREE